MKNPRFFYLLGWLLLGIIFASCESVGPPAARTGPNEFSSAQAAAQRPGLGTKWGETHNSRIFLTGFRRANRTHPLATAAIYYNDAPGIAAMAGATELRRTWPALPSPLTNLISVGLRDQSGAFLPGRIVGDKWFVVGEKGRRYSIIVRNHCELRLEIVLSVDGLDVLDGRSASLTKRGYIIPPRGELKVDGFRQSMNEVAAFRFGSVRESYANLKYGETRNVGVIGLALFNEEGTNPFEGSEAQRRLRANPFPGERNRFATPP